MSTKRRAALERAEEERRRRIDEKVESGAAIRVPLIVIGGVSSPGDLDVEAARTRKLAELQRGGEKREVVFDPVEVIFTGVPRPSGDIGQSAPCSELPIAAPQKPRDPQDIPAFPKPEPEVESAPRSIRIQVRPGNGADDAGEIAEGEFTVQGAQLRLYLGAKTFTEWLKPTDDPEAVARRLLRTHCGRTGFNGPLSYRRRGIV